MGRDVTHPLAAPTWVPSVTGAWWLEQLQHCSPPAGNSGSDHSSQTLQHPQAHPREFSFQAHRRPCLKMDFPRSINTGINRGREQAQAVTHCLSLPGTSVPITMGSGHRNICLCSALGLGPGLKGLCCLTEPWNGLGWVERDLKDHLISTRKGEKWGLNWPLSLQGWKHKTSLQMLSIQALKVL